MLQSKSPSTTTHSQFNGLTSSMDTRLTEVLVCPVCKGPLTLCREKNELQCAKCAMGFPIVDDIPVMLTERARALSKDEAAKARVKPLDNNE